MKWFSSIKRNSLASWSAIIFFRVLFAVQKAFFFPENDQAHSAPSLISRILLLLTACCKNKNKKSHSVDENQNLGYLEQVAHEN